MTQAIQQSLRDKAWARWTVLILIALTMFFAYMFVDVLSPLKSMLEKTAEEGGLDGRLPYSGLTALVSSSSMSSSFSSSLPGLFWTKWGYDLRLYCREL